MSNPYTNPVQRWLWQVGYNFGYRTAGRVFKYRIARSIGYWWFDRR